MDRRYANRPPGRARGRDGPARGGRRHEVRRPGAAGGPARGGRRQRPAVPPGRAADKEAGQAAGCLEKARELFGKKRYGEALREYDRLSRSAGDGKQGVPAGTAATVRREAERCRHEVDRIEGQLAQIRGRDGRDEGGGGAKALSYRKAVCEHRLGRHREALETLGADGKDGAVEGEAEGVAAADHRAAVLAGDCLNALRRHAEAEYAYLHALDDDSITAGKCVQVGDLLAGEGRYAGAESAYARAEEKGADAHRKRENCRARIGTTDFAPGGIMPEGRAERAGVAGGIAFRARRLDKEGRYDDAVPMYVKAFHADPRMPDEFAERMARLAGGGGGARAAPEPPHNAGKIPGGTAFVVDSNVCVKAMITRALGGGRSKIVPRRWAGIPGIAASFEKNVRSGAYVLPFRAYHETRSLLYSARGTEGLGMNHSDAVEVCKAASGRLGRLWDAYGTRSRPTERLVAEARRGMWAGWIAADSATKADWRQRKEVPGRPYDGGCPGEGADMEILASAIMIRGGSGVRKGAEPPKSVALLTRDSDFTTFAGAITGETGVRIVSEFA